VTEFTDYYNTARSSMVSDHLLPTRELPDDFETLKAGQVEVKHYAVWWSGNAVVTILRASSAAPSLIQFQSEDVDAEPVGCVLQSRHGELGSVTGAAPKGIIRLLTFDLHDEATNGNSKNQPQTVSSAIIRVRGNRHLDGDVWTRYWIHSTQSASNDWRRRNR
jgi:hypothetical protein